MLTILESKAPADDLHYGVVWGEIQRPEYLTSVSVSVARHNPSERRTSKPITLETPDPARVRTYNSASIRVRSGEVGDHYILTFVGTTSEGRVLQDSVMFKVVNR